VCQAAYADQQVDNLIHIAAKLISQRIDFIGFMGKPNSTGL
jgi:hypothetical protein